MKGGCSWFWSLPFDIAYIPVSLPIFMVMVILGRLCSLSVQFLFVCSGFFWLFFILFFDWRCVQQKLINAHTTSQVWVNNYSSGVERDCWMWGFILDICQKNTKISILGFVILTQIIPCSSLQCPFFGHLSFSFFLHVFSEPAGGMWAHRIQTPSVVMSNITVHSY